MTTDDFSDAALVLVGHGSTLNADSAAPISQHAQGASAPQDFRSSSGRILETGTGHRLAWCAGALVRRVFIVPLFISEGYFVEGAIPRELGLRAAGQPDFPRVQERGSQTLLLRPDRNASQHDRRAAGPRPRHHREAPPSPARPGRRRRLCSLPAMAPGGMRTPAKPSNARRT